ncbi:MAG: DUF2934 domain-containing protein [Nitrospirae bacterium]|nr:DUF2934 domain-containing protein [Nitrospirota bacterium]
MNKKKAKPVKAKSPSKPISKPKSPPRSPPRDQPKPIELPDGMWERIAKKAYELYEQRGKREGHALEDWLEAEAIVMEEIHEARE